METMRIFGIQRIISSPLITYNVFFSSNGDEQTGGNMIRPVVELNSNIIIDLNSGDGTSSDNAYALSLK